MRLPNVLGEDQVVSIGEDGEEAIEYGFDDEPFLTTEDPLSTDDLLDFAPSSLPIPVVPALQGLDRSRARSTNRDLGTISEREEYQQFAEQAIASTAPTARTFQERTNELLRKASRSDAKLQSQKSVRRKIYDELDRQRQVDPGPEYTGEDGSDTDTESLSQGIR